MCFRLAVGKAECGEFAEGLFRADWPPPLTFSAFRRPIPRGRLRWVLSHLRNMMEAQGRL
jgi:hypothetical protein